MIHKKNVTKIFKNVIKRDHGLPDRRLMHPKREWLVGLCMFLVLILAGGLYALFAFHSYSGISVDDQTVEVNQLHYKRADALEAIDLYKQKRDTFESLHTNKPNVDTVSSEPVPESAPIEVVESEADLQIEELDSSQPETSINEPVVLE